MTLPSDPGSGLTLVWDTSPLHHAIGADRIDVLSDIASGNPQTPWRNVRTAAVTEELRRHDLPVDGLGWLEEVHVDGLAELASLAGWVAVVSGQRANQGEATVLARAEVHAAIAVVDDADARRAARRAGLRVHGVHGVHGVLWVIATAVADGRRSPAGATGFVDSPIDSGARYPCRRGCFVPWAKSVGLL